MRLPGTHKIEHTRTHALHLLTSLILTANTTAFLTATEHDKAENHKLVKAFDESAENQKLVAAAMVSELSLPLSSGLCLWLEANCLITSRLLLTLHLFLLRSHTHTRAHSPCASALWVHCLYCFWLFARSNWTPPPIAATQKCPTSVRSQPLCVFACVCVCLCTCVCVCMCLLSLFSHPSPSPTLSLCLWRFV